MATNQTKHDKRSAQLFRSTHASPSFIRAKIFLHSEEKRIENEVNFTTKHDWKIRNGQRKKVVSLSLNKRNHGHFDRFNSLTFDSRISFCVLLSDFLLQNQLLGMMNVQSKVGEKPPNLWLVLFNLHLFVHNNSIEMIPFEFMTFSLNRQIEIYAIDSRYFSHQRKLKRKLSYDWMTCVKLRQNIECFSVQDWMHDDIHHRHRKIWKIKREK